LILGLIPFNDVFALTEIVKLIASDAAGSDTLDHISVSISGDKAIVGAFANDDAGSMSGSAYIFERDSGGSWSEVAKLLASDAASGDNFGFSVSISGDKAIVGAFNNDDAGNRSGSAYIFERDSGGSWSEVAKLLASDAGDSADFGGSVSISGDRAIVGARFGEGASTRAGSAYIFERDSGGIWNEVAKLTASDGQIFDGFGDSVSISGDRAIVGADDDDDVVIGQGTGSAYIFERDSGGIWSEVAKLTASDIAAGDNFGDSVSISGDRAIVGAFANDDAGSMSGSAYIFERDSGGSWSEVAKLLASDAVASDDFGFSVSISGDRAIVGADRVAISAGAAYIFERDLSGIWNEVAKLSASDAASADHFGFSVSTSGDRVLIGAWGDDDAGFDSGSAYVFGDGVINNPPTADAGGIIEPYTGDEGSPISIDGSASSDPDGDSMTFDWSTSVEGTIADPATAATIVTYVDNGNFIVDLEVTDTSDNSDIDSAVVTVNNVAPSVGSITDLPINPIPVGTTVVPTVDFTDPGTTDTHTAEWDWGDETIEPGTVAQGSGTGLVSDSHTYNTPSIYTVAQTVTDDDGGVGQSIFQFVVVFDPSGGFVTGGGWINSPEGAYTADESLTGKANFGFVSKYTQGTTTPSGNTKFVFKIAGLNFHSDVYEWLVVAGHKAQFKGTGTINGEGNYGFKVFTIDENLTPSTDDDLFRIKIWDKNNADAVVYDNELLTDEAADPTTAIGGGSIVIHQG